MKLLLDLGNTRLKWAFATEPLIARAAAWNDASSLAALVATWAGAGRIEATFGACVTSAARRDEVAARVAAAGAPPPVWLHSPAVFAGLHNAYPRPADLGIDRFLALLAAWRAGLAPCVIAGCGSALTLDALDAHGRHGGGLIGAGVAAMRDALVRVVPGLPVGAPDADTDAADNTVDAVGAGPWQAAAGAIERFARGQAKRLGIAPRVVLTGGDAPRLAALLGPSAEVLPDAVLRGLAAWVREVSAG